MNYSRLRFSKETSDLLGGLQAQTGLTPNLLARIGFSLSLQDPTLIAPEAYTSDGEREIDRHTLTGQWDALFMALFKERCHQDGVHEDEQWAYFRAHMNRGVLLLSKQVYRLPDMLNLFH